MKIIKEKIIFQGKIVEVVHQLVKICEQEFVFEIARRSPGVRLIICDKDKILLTKEYRKELKGFDYRLPGGKVFDTLKEYNKNKKNIKKYALAAAKRECEEETGLIIQNPTLYYISKAGATVEWDLYYYIVKKFTYHAKGQQLEIGEYIDVEWKTKKEILSLIKKGEIHEDRSVGVLMRYLS
ncbi:MAG: NUDIX domain-containing protein [Candidatus Absconditabacterales bacterium]